MSENPDITRYFSDDTSKSSSAAFGNIGFLQLSKNEEEQESDEPAVCTLFQSASNVTANSDASSFFDMIGSSAIGNLNLDIGGEARLDDHPLSTPGRLSISDQPLSKPGRVSETDRSRDAWIPPESTRRILIAMVTSPPGTYNQERDNLTMPGVVLEEDMVTYLLDKPGPFLKCVYQKDTVTEAVNHYLGPAEGAKRKVLTASDVTQDDRGLRSLIKVGCYRAAVNLTKPLLTIYGQGAGRAGHPSKHTVHSIQLWFTRLSLLVKLRSFMVADVEAEPFGDMDRPDLFFQFYPELYGGRLGSLVPFGFRLLLAQIPMYIEKHQICLTKLHKILATVRKMIGNLEKGLLEDGTPCDISITSKEEALAIWRHRETLVLHSIVNCALAFKDYTLAIEVMQMLLSRDLKEQDQAILQSALGRILLQLGDIISAKKQFEALRQCNNPNTSVRCLVDSGLLLVSDSRFKEALSVFEQAAKCDPSNVMVLNNLSVCLLYLGRLREAVALLETGIRTHPTLALHESYLVNLCNLYELQSTQCLNSKLQLLSLISRYRGDNVNIACLKL